MRTGDNSMTNKTSNCDKPVTHIAIARVTIEFETPFHIGSGDEGDISDAAVVCDVNGLPTLPGTSLAGVLRSAFSERFGQENENKLFGYQKDKEGKGSKLTISWGCIHDSHDIPVEGLVDSVRLNDVVLINALSPTLRDHVKINHLGVSSSEERGKFDEMAVCKGHRFTFECMLQGRKDDLKLWDDFIELLSDKSIRIGGKTRRGFGAFKIVKLLSKVFSLNKYDDFKAFSSYSSRLDTYPERFEEFQNISVTSSDAKKRTIVLKPLEYWMFGGGEDILDGDFSDNCENGEVHDSRNDVFKADIAPVRDRAVIWESNPAKIKRNLVIIPGSSIKGALAHRVAYHYNRLNGIFGDKMTEQDFIDSQKKNHAVQELFGFAKSIKDKKSKDQHVEEKKSIGQRGKVIIDDVYIDTEIQTQLVHHVSIDRFTGGARTGGLFNERPFWQGPEISLTIWVTGSQSINDDNVWNALNEAIKDLCESRLALGGGTGRGHGFFKVIQDIGWKPPKQKGELSND